MWAFQASLEQNIDIQMMQIETVGLRREWGVGKAGKRALPGRLEIQTDIPRHRENPKYFPNADARRRQRGFDWDCAKGMRELLSADYNKRNEKKSEEKAK